MDNEVKFCKDIGIFTINRSREHSCRHATDYCKEHCYCGKFERLYGRFKEAVQDKEEAYWKQLTGFRLAVDLDTKRKPTDRIRLMSRGEAIVNVKDILKVRDLCMWNKDRLFMMPTRAWRKKNLLQYMLTAFEEVPNLRLLFSTDPDSFGNALTVISNNMPHPVMARMSLTYFGQNEEWGWHQDAVKCPKTWHKSAGIDCSNCINGCFKEDPTKLKIIHFRKH